MHVPGLTALHLAWLTAVLLFAGAGQPPAGALVRVGQAVGFHPTVLAGAPWMAPARLNASSAHDGPRAPERIPAERPLPVMTWNIHSAPLAAIEPELRQSGADIIALQEVRSTRAELARLAGSLGMEGLFLVLQPRSKPFGIVLMSRHPVDEVRYRFLPSGLEPRAYLMAATAGLVVVNTHLEPSPRRRAQLRQLREAVRELKWPVVLLGDLNEEGLGPFFDGFVDAGQDAGITYPNLRARIDYILVRGRQAGPARVLPTAKSDHYPVVAEVW